MDRLTVTYGEKLAVDGVSFSLSPGKIYVIVGESGSGKSTLLRTIGGLLTKEGKIVSGDIWMGEQNLISFQRRNGVKSMETKWVIFFRTRNSH